MGVLRLAPGPLTAGAGNKTQWLWWCCGRSPRLPLVVVVARLGSATELCYNGTMDMKTTIAHLRLPSPWTGRPADIAARYGDRPFEFDTADRAASSEEHRLLFEAVAEAKKAGRCGWFRCACRDDIELAVMVRARQPLPYLALMPGTSLQHHPLCAFHRAPITSHVSDHCYSEST